MSDSAPVWTDYEKSCVAATISNDKVFRDAEDFMERRIRERAYQLWDRAERPERRSDEFWFAAHAEFERDAVEQIARFRGHQLTRAFGDVSESMDAGT